MSNCKASSKGKWGEYQIISDTEKVMIGKYANDCGVASATRIVKDKNLKESPVRDWRNYYNCEVVRLQKEAKVRKAC